MADPNDIGFQIYSAFMSVTFVICYVGAFLFSPLLYLIYYVLAFVITLPVSPVTYIAWIVMLITDSV